MGFRGPWKLYELRIADVLRHKYAGIGSVDSNVRVRGRFTQRRPRQIDVLVRNMADPSDIWLVVDCKLRRRKVDVPDVEAFLGFVRDIGVENGIIVTEAGCSWDAARRIREVESMAIRLMTRAEVLRWSPRGTVTATIEVEQGKVADATHALWAANLRTRVVTGLDDQVEVHKNYGEYPPPIEAQNAHLESIRKASVCSGLTFRFVSHGIVIDGGTSDHRWVEVEPIGIKVLASTPAELELQIERLRLSLSERGLPPLPLTAKVPAAWNQPRGETSLNDWQPPEVDRHLQRDG